MVADELGRFCAELPELRAALRRTPRQLALLDRAEHALREGEPVAPLLRQLGIAVDEDTGPLAGRDAGATTAPVRSAPHVVTGSYLCPRRSCLRVDERRPGDELPVCHVYGEALRFVPDGR
ncbi:hypothetical protein ACFYY3_05740 [Streptomyces sp. NPDC001812]|uniref:Uncharacterized protein n=1 Tax=Streptomyces cathayae TaxID=3031124 RepID=A0ABY8JZP9_9ACTN|nr:hypothetical protein [Streptomyces sp. HUAS 5]WGD40151.1 hypothetical protein PYS65_08420 [Streptomyces sp. HUAS 5]